MNYVEDPLQAVDLDDIERQIRETAPSRTAPFQPGVSDKKDEQEAENGSAQDSDESVDQVFYDYSLAWVPNTPDAALAPRALKKRSRLSLYVLALAEPLLLVTVGVGLAVVMRAGQTDELGSKAPVIKAEDAPAQEARVAAPDVQTPSQPALGTASSLVTPDQPVDVIAATNSGPPPSAVLPAAPTVRMVATDVSLPYPPEPASDTSTLGTPDRISTASIKPDLTSVSKGEPETAPLPPTKPRSLASTDPTALVRANKRSDAVANAAGASSFSIQLASSHSKSDALAIFYAFEEAIPRGARRRFHPSVRCGRHRRILSCAGWTTIPRCRRQGVRTAEG
jgi:hypothetical protein